MAVKKAEVAEITIGRFATNKSARVISFGENLRLIPGLPTPVTDEQVEIIGVNSNISISE